MSRKQDPLEGYPRGATDHDDDDVLLQLVGGQGVAVPRSLQRLDADAKLDVADLMRCVAALAELQDQVGLLVDDLRGQGVSWSGIGWALGTTGEAARQRFGGEA